MVEGALRCFESLLIGLETDVSYALRLSGHHMFVEVVCGLGIIPSSQLLVTSGHARMNQTQAKSLAGKEKNATKF